MSERLWEKCRKPKPKSSKTYLPAKQKWAILKPVLPVASGGLHPRLVPALMETFGNDFVIQAGGGIHGHPDGTICGAKAMRQAVDATL